MQEKRKALGFVFKTSRKNVSWFLSLRKGHQNKLKDVNPSLHRDLESEICYCFLLDMGFFVLSERVCSRTRNARSLLLD